MMSSDTCSNFFILSFRTTPLFSVVQSVLQSQRKREKKNEGQGESVNVNIIRYVPLMKKIWCAPMTTYTYISFSRRNQRK
jgi:hypothetical protein